MASDAGSTAVIRSRSEFLESVRTLLRGLPQVKPRDLLIVDADFAPWPLGDADVVDALTRWVRLPARRLRLLGGRFDVIERGQPRFAAWRKAFAHAIECSTPSELEPGDMPSLLLLDAVGVQLIDREHWQGRVSDDRRWLVEQRESTDALLQRSESAWPVTVLGL
jgi:hypothetical protein